MFLGKVKARDRPFRDRKYHELSAFILQIHFLKKALQLNFRKLSVSKLFAKDTSFCYLCVAKSSVICLPV